MAYTANKYCTDSSLRELASVSSLPCVVRRRSTVRKPSKISPTKRNVFWADKAEIGKPPRRRVNGPRMVEELTRCREEGESYSVLRPSRIPECHPHQIKTYWRRNGSGHQLIKSSLRHKVRSMRQTPAFWIVVRTVGYAAVATTSRWSDVISSETPKL